MFKSDKRKGANTQEGYSRVNILTGINFLKDKIEKIAVHFVYYSYGFTYAFYYMYFLLLQLFEVGNLIFYRRIFKVIFLLITVVLKLIVFFILKKRCKKIQLIPIFNAF